MKYFKAKSFHTNSVKSSKPQLKTARLFSREDLSILITHMGVCIFKIKMSLTFSVLWEQQLTSSYLSQISSFLQVVKVSIYGTFHHVSRMAFVPLTQYKNIYSLEDRSSSSTAMSGFTPYFGLLTVYFHVWLLTPQMLTNSCRTGVGSSPKVSDTHQKISVKLNFKGTWTGLFIPQKNFVLTYLYLKGSAKDFYPSTCPEKQLWESKVQLV